MSTALSYACHLAGPIVPAQKPQQHARQLHNQRSGMQALNSWAGLRLAVPARGAAASSSGRQPRARSRCTVSAALQQLERVELKDSGGLTIAPIVK